MNISIIFCISLHLKKIKNYFNQEPETTDQKLELFLI